ncbi:MAG: hypothetical protein AAF915_01470 [Cyanobacteria bacterium P01_D01_bin.50]
MKRKNNNFWRRWIVLGATIFIIIFIILLFNLLFFPLNQKEPVSNGDLWEYIGVSIGTSAKLAGEFMVYSLLIHILFDILFPFIARTIRIPFYEPRNYHWENEYLKKKKTIWTILKNGFFFVFFLNIGLITTAYISSIIQGKKFLWHTLPQVFFIGIVGAIVIYIFLLLAEESWK